MALSGFRPRPYPEHSHTLMNPLIFLPGLASDTRMWQDQLDAMPSAWTTCVSDVHFRHASIADMAKALLAEHPGDKLVLCGASMGGMVAMEAARQCPERIRGLALLGTSARPETPDIQALREAAMVLFEQGRALEVLQANVPLAFHASRLQDTARLFAEGITLNRQKVQVDA